MSKKFTGGQKIIYGNSPKRKGSEGAAIELATVSNFSEGALKPSQVFGENFRPPQSFRYLSLDEVEKLNFYFGVE